MFYLFLVCPKLKSDAFSGDHSSLNYLTTSLHLKTCPLNHPVYKSLIVWYFLAKIPCFYFFLVFFFIFETKDNNFFKGKKFFITFNSLNVCLIEESTLQIIHLIVTLLATYYILHLSNKAAVKQSVNFCLLFG